MITLTTTTEIFIQVHKNHVSKPIIGGGCFVRFTGFNDKSIITSAQVQTLANCYLVSVAWTVGLRTLGLNSKLELLVNDEVVYTSDVQWHVPDTQLEPEIPSDI